jgi:hypothetical protein
VWKSLNTSNYFSSSKKNYGHAISLGSVLIVSTLVFHYGRFSECVLRVPEGVRMFVLKPPKTIAGIAFRKLPKEPEEGKGKKRKTKWNE